jgi:hypothetical protein
MMANKIIGYTLLAVGILLIGFALWQSYGIFTGASSVPIVFKSPESRQDTATNGSGSVDFQKQFDNAVKNQISQLLPIDVLSKMLNMLAWSMLAGILIFGGAQIAGLGIRMIK